MEPNAGELLTRSIPTFTASFSFQRRDRWLSDLKRAFKSAPQNFQEPEQKTIFALDNMDKDCRQRWDQHLAESAESAKSGQERFSDDWLKFKEWTMTLLRDSSSRLPFIRIQLEAATQRENQSL